MQLFDLIQGLPILQVIGDTECEIENLFFDSRKVVEKSVYIATVGSFVDGHLFINAAIGGIIK